MASVMEGSESFSSPDSNNNHAEPEAGKPVRPQYSLRPRSAAQKAPPPAPSPEPAPPAGHRSSGGRSRSSRKPPPLSKYRRKTANARERDRMREINAAFETLRRAVPTSYDLDEDGHNNGEKLTKITTLRLAMKYIAALSHVLRETQNQSLEQHPLTHFHQQQAPQNFQTHQFHNSHHLHHHHPHQAQASTMLVAPSSELEGLLLESDGESLTFHSDCLSEHCLTPPPSLTSADFVTPDFGDSLTPPEFSDHGLGVSPDFCDPCLTPPGFSEHCLTP